MIKSNPTVVKRIPVRQGSILAIRAVVAALLLLFIQNMTPPVASADKQNDQTTAASETQDPPHIVFLTKEDPNNYEAHLTIPRFAGMLSGEHGFQATVIQAKGELPAIRFHGLEVLSEADLLVIYFRRAALPQEQLNLIKTYLNEGNPLVAIRTANHGFSVRDEDGEIPEGYEDWWDFVPDILGCENRGYGPTELGTRVTVAPAAEGHPVLEGFEPPVWHSTGNVYHTAPLVDRDATVLLHGTVEEDIEPIAWTRMAGGSRVFYTSLGHPADFGVPQFRTLLLNGIRWALD